MQLEFFPSRTMSFYMARMFMVRVFAVLAMLVLILQTLDLLGESGAIMAQPGNGDAQLWTYVGLRLPQLVAQFLPFSVLLATIITLITMNQNSEVIAMKASGLSAHQILAPLILSSLILAMFAFAFNERIVTRATATLSAWEEAEYGPIPEDSGVRTNIWVKDGPDVIHAQQVLGNLREPLLRNVTYYRRSDDGGLLAIATGNDAQFTSNGWRMQNVRNFDIGSGEVTTIDEEFIGESVQPDQFTLSNVDADSLGWNDLNAAIDELEIAGKRTASLKSSLWHKLAGPLSSVLMPLLGAVAGFGLARSGHLFIRAVIGMALGFTYFVVDNFALAMADLGVYPPFLAAWSPVLLFLLVGETVLIRTEE